MQLDHQAAKASLGELLYSKNLGSKKTFDRLVPKRCLAEKILEDWVFVQKKIKIK